MMKIVIRDGVRIAYLWHGDDATALIHFGNNEACKTEADAREAAELLKAFFEAKQKGETPIQPHCCVLKGGDPNTCQFDGCPTKEAQRQKNKTGCENCKTPLACFHGNNCQNIIGPDEYKVPGLITDEPQRPKTQAIQIANASRERKESFKVAKLAALIFAHNAHDFDERRAVQSAAKILGYAKEGV